MSYTYYVSDRLVGVAYGTATTVLQYDLGGRKLAMDDPDMGDWSYTYDALGNLLSQADGRGCTTTAFVGNHLEWTGSTASMKRYYNAGGQRVAMREGSSTLYYLLTDHLGSTAITATSSGGVYSELRYMPWGGTRYSSSVTTPTTYRYTGQREAEVGLYYYGARYYDPMLGRWIQPDSIIPESVQGVQAWDRFAYVNNAPTTGVDTVGHWRDEIGDSRPIISYMYPNPDYSAWYSGVYSGCTMCHYAHAQGQAILTNEQLATADHNAREWIMIGVTPMVGVTITVGGLEVMGGSVASAPTIGTMLCADGDCGNEVSTGLNTVYNLVENGVTRYVGITNDIVRRAGEHFRANGWNINPIPGLENLSRYDARAVEQVLINNYGLDNLFNQINSISASNPIYQAAILRGM